MKKVFSVLLSIILLMSFTSCNNEKGNGLALIDPSESKLFYTNKTELFGADPFILIEQEDGETIFYLFSTSRELSAKGFETYVSNDLSNWKKADVAFTCEGSVWCNKSLWAPEVIKGDDGLYYLFYSAQWNDDNQGFYLSCAVSRSPSGPYSEYSSDKKTTLEPLIQFENHYNQIPSSLRSSLSGHDDKVGYIKAIDASPFVDPVTGKKYLYFIADLNTAYTENSFVMAMEMEDWVTPKYETLTQITEFGKVSPGSEDMVLEGGRTNEGCSMNYFDGTYYLTFSTFTYMTAEYQVRQAIGDNPLGPFRKIQNNDGGTVIFTEASNIRQSAGHSSIFELGDDVYITYHSFFNDKDIDDGRKPAVDKISFVKNSEGITVMQANGPTCTPQPLPEYLTGYKNLALDAKITCNNTAGNLSVDLLNDNYIPLHRMTPVSEFIINAGESEITLEFNDTKEIAAVLVYTSVKDAMRLSEIKSVIFENGEEKVSAKNILLDDSKYIRRDKIAYEQPCAIVLQEHVNANKITININEDYSVGIPEIIVLGR